jgi:hypothetical protein
LTNKPEFEKHKEACETFCKQSGNLKKMFVTLWADHQPEIVEHPDRFKIIEYIQDNLDSSIFEDTDMDDDCGMRL